MLKNFMIQALKISVAAGYVIGAIGAAIILVREGNQPIDMIVAVPAILQSAEMAATWAARFAGRNLNRENPPTTG